MTKRLVVLALAAITFAAAPQGLKAADDDALCPRGNATLSGRTYMVNGGGTIVGVGPVSAIGTIAYDATGNSVNTFTVSINGVISRGVTVTGPYTVNSDCTGTLTQSDGTHYDFVVAPDASTVNWIETDTGTVVSGIEHLLKHSGELTESNALCRRGNATLSRTYMVIGGGTVLGVGPVSGVGTIAYDGKGNNSVNIATVSINGVITRGYTVTGPYTVNSDCTGTLTQSDGTHYDMVVAPDGSTVNWIETDTGTVVSGTELLLKHSGGLTESNRDAVKIPLDGAATPESLATILSSGQPQVSPLGDFDAQFVLQSVENYAVLEGYR